MNIHEFLKVSSGASMNKQYVQITKCIDYDASFCVDNKKVSFVVYDEGSMIYEEELTKEDLESLIDELKKALVSLKD